MLGLPFTSVVSYHTNPMTCGVAKFSAELAKRLGVPFHQLDDVDCRAWGAFPLLSLKWAEFGYPALGSEVASKLRERGVNYAVFWHDTGDPVLNQFARMVFYADPSLGSPGLWCPSLLTPSRKRPIRLFSFGMAHKLQVERYRRVRQLLDEAEQPYHLRVSVGLHEGTSLDDATKHFDALKDVMGEAHVTILGILSDDAVAEELANADYVLAFFEHGLRANNTTVHAAILSHASVVTNHDDDTPMGLRTRTIDVGIFDRVLAKGARYSWDNLIAEMKGVCDRSRLATTR